MIMLLGGEKGGTGKTSIAINLAVSFAQDGRDVLLIDTDRQGSSNFWANTRDETGTLPRIPCVQSFGKGLAQNILDLAQRYEDIIIDAGGRDSMELRYSMGVADKMVIPCQPTQFDLMTLGQMSTLVEQAQTLNPSLVAYVVLTRCATNPAVTDAQEASEVISEIPNLILLRTILKERVSYQRSVREGLGVAEATPPDNKAIVEIRELFQEIFDAQKTDIQEASQGFDQTGPVRTTGQ